MSGYLLLIMIISLLPLAALFPTVALLLYNFLNYVSPQTVVYSPFGSQSYSLWAAVALVISFAFFEKKSLQHRAMFVILMTLFIIWVIITTQYAQGIPAWAADKQDRALKTLFVAVLAVFILSSRERIEALLLVLFIGIASNGFLHGTRAILTGGSHGLVENKGKVYQESSVLSMLMVIGIVIILYLRKHSVLVPKIKFLGLFYLGLSGLMMACLIGLQARTGLVCLGVFILIQIFTSEKKLPAIAGLALAVVLLPAVIPDSFKERLGTVETFGQDKSATGRVDAWVWGWELAQENPIFGGGFSVYESIHRKASHNWFFEILGEHGFVGISLFFFIILVVFLSNRKTKRLTHGVPEYEWAYDLAKTLNLILILWFTGGMFTGIGFASLHFDLGAASVGLAASVVQQLGASRRGSGYALRKLNAGSFPTSNPRGGAIPAAKV